MNYQTSPEGPGSNVDTEIKDPLKDKSMSELVQMLADDGRIDDTDKPEIEALLSRFEGDKDAIINLVQNELQEPVKDMLENGYTLTDKNSYETFKKVVKLAGVNVPVKLPKEVINSGGIISLRLLNGDIHVYNTSTHRGIIDSEGNFIAGLGDGDGRFDNNKVDISLNQINIKEATALNNEIANLDIKKRPLLMVKQIMEEPTKINTSRRVNADKLNDYKKNLADIKAWNKKVDVWNENLDIVGKNNIELIKNFGSLPIDEQQELLVSIDNNIENAALNGKSIDKDFFNTINVYTRLGRGAIDLEKNGEQMLNIYKEIVKWDPKKIDNMTMNQLVEVYEKLQLKDGKIPFGEIFEKIPLFFGNKNLRDKIETNIKLIVEALKKENKDRINEGYSKKEVRESIAYMKRKYSVSELKMIQEQIAERVPGSLGLSGVDGNWGPLSDAGFKKLQLALGLNPDGKLGIKSLAKLHLGRNKQRILVKLDNEGNEIIT